MWWYRSAAHDLQRLRPHDARAALAADAACAQPWLASAPAALLVAARPERAASRYGPARGERYVLMEAGCAAQNALLAAEQLGFGAAWVGAFHDDGVRDAVGLPPGLRPLALLPFGKAAPPAGGAAAHAAALREEAAQEGPPAGEAQQTQQRRAVPIRDTEHDID